MALTTDNLKAFLTIYEVGSFTRAASKLGLTQSALSQKMARLEDFLETTLFIRKPSGLDLTSAGVKLLPYAKQQLQTEEEFLHVFHSNQEEIRGSLRLGAYSSIMRSLLIPQLTPFIKKHVDASIEFASFEMGELAGALKSGKMDMILTDYYPAIPGCEEIKVGEEDFVLIESSRHDSPNIYLDHDSKDNSTEEFFKFQGWQSTFRRGYMGDVYGILDGVAQGLGKAVMSKHLVEGDKRFKIIKTKKRYVRPIVLSFFRQGYYSRLHHEVQEQLVKAKF